MDKNKIYKIYKWIYTKKQIDEIINWKRIPTSWWEKEKEVKKTWNCSKKVYKKDVFKM